MNSEQLLSANKIFKNHKKVDIIYTSEEITHKLTFFYQQILQSLIGKTPFFVSPSKIRKLPFNFQTFEYTYPTSCFISQCISKHVIISQLTRIQHFLIILSELIDFDCQKHRKRELFYKHSEHFKQQSELDEIFKQMFFTLKIKRSQLNIFNSPKGLVFGPLVISLENEDLSLNHSAHQNSGQLINFEDFTICESNLRIILIVEKETVFFSLLSRKFSLFFPDVLLITGRGYPDFTTKRFVKRLLECLPGCYFFYLGDFDPFGIDILLNYLFSTPLTVFENNNVPVIQPIGVDSSDFEFFGNNLPVISLTSEDFEKIGYLKELPFLKEEYLEKGNVCDDFQYLMRWKMRGVIRNLEFMQKTVRKIEVEHLEAGGISLMDYLLKKINV